MGKWSVGSRVSFEGIEGRIADANMGPCVRPGEGFVAPEGYVVIRTDADSSGPQQELTVYQRDWGLIEPLEE